MSTATTEKPKVIHIEGRRWFQKTCGNTYHSVSIYVDGKQVHRIDFAYGYDRMYAQNAMTWLVENGYAPDADKHESLWRYCDRYDIVFTDCVTDVSRKKDL